MILVTGATGLVGTALVSELSRREIAHRAVSRAVGPGLIVLGTIDAATDWGPVLSGVDTVIHLAARVHVMNDTATDPLSAFRATNVDATLNLARQAAALGARRFVFVSSVKVNGEATQPGRAFTADDVPAPQDPYGQSKLEAERALLDLGRQTGLEVVVVRPPLVYGPGVKANFAAMVRWVDSGIPLPLGSIRNKRSIVFVGNLVDFLIQCSRHPAAANRIFLISDGDDLSTTEMLKGIAAALHKSSRAFPFPVPILKALATLTGKRAVADRLFGSLQIDITKNRQLLDWTPRFTTKDGLRATVRPDQR